MCKYLLRKLVLAIPTMIGASLIVFVGLRLVPGDPAIMMAGDLASPAEVQKLREDLGLNQPVFVQYAIFVGSVLRGDFGRSLQSRKPVVTMIADALPISVELAVISLVMACVIGITTGTVSAMKQYSIFDNVLTLGVLAGISIPAFWAGILLILFLGLFLGLFPIGGVLSDRVSLHRITGFILFDSAIQGNWEAFQDGLAHLAMPAIVLALAPTAIISRMTRSAILEVLREDYMRTARSKGLSERAVIIRHGLKNALIPVITLVGLQAGYLISGAVVVETVFARPGVGWLAANGVLFRDYPLVQGIIFFSVALFVLINLSIDLAYAFLDPRIRYS